MNKLTGLKIVLLLICVYHIVLGAAAFVSDDLAVRIGRTIFGLNLEMTPQLGYIVQLLGVYALIFGVMTGFVAADPVRHSVMLNVVVILYALRVLNKFLSMDEFRQAFGASMAKVWTDVVLLAAFGVAVLVLKPRGGGVMHA
jgi:hypothetical protein